MRSDGVSMLYSDVTLAELYDIRQVSRQDIAYCVHLARGARSVLDLGCGTGELAAKLGKKRRVVGVDPAAGMLEVARRRDGSESVKWVEADARTLRLDESFDLVVITGHAFQVFLDREQQLACLQTVAAHLAPGGTFIFDTRNPDFPDPKTRTKSQTFHVHEHPDLGLVEKWNVSNYDADRRVLSYSNHYRIVRSGLVRSADDKILYTPRSDLAEMIAIAGLSVDRWHGDWNGAPFTKDTEEIIPLGRFA